MPVVDIDPDELRALTDHEEKTDEDLQADLFDLGLEFEGWTDDEEMQLEFAPDRLDRLSVEGVARSLRYHYGDDRGVYVPSTNDPEWTVRVEDQPPDRPYVTGAVIRDVDFTEGSLESLIQLQEKLHATMGRQRAKGAIGVHDLIMLKGHEARGASEQQRGEETDPRADATTDEAHSNPGKRVRYTSVDPDDERFVPLDADTDMTPAAVLSDHPVGETYAGLVEGFDRVPAIYDAIGLFSFPPVINGRRTEVTTESRDLFVEMTGTDQWTVDRMCNIVCYALAARGGQVERVDVSYADDAPGEYAGKTLERPDFSVRIKTVTHDRIESILGVSLDSREVVDYAERAGLAATETESAAAPVYEVSVPPYRVDALHPLDIIDDIGRAYGFNELEPRYPDVSTVGGRHERSRLEDAARDALVGLGFEDLLNFHMINEAENFERMRVDTDGDCLGAGDPVTIREPYSEDYTILRTWALPSLMMVLENNTHRSYPQDLAEVGLAAEVDEDVNTGAAERRTVAAALARTDVSYEDAKARLQALATAFGKDLATPATRHPSFIDGRAATVVLDGEPAGVIGELHPAVLVEHDLEVPVAAFELELDALS